MNWANDAKFVIEPVWQFIPCGTAFHLVQFVAVSLGLGWIHRNRAAAS
jgi:hypothetical protein